MIIRPLTVLLPLALSFGLAACDSRDYEAEIAELQSQLGDANSELDSIRGDNETLKSQMEELRSQAEQAAASAGSLGEEAAAAVRSRLESALEKASQTADRLAALEKEPDAPADARTEAVGVLKSDVQEIVDSVQAAASELGLELQPGVEPAAGAGQQQGQPAAGAAQPAPEQPAGTQTPPKQ